MADFGKKLKLVFFVVESDEAGNFAETSPVAVEKSQLLLEIGTDQASSLTIEGLARDHIAEEVAFLADAKAKGILTDAAREQCKIIYAQNGVVDELLACAVDLVQRFVRLKLREWARRKLKETEPV